MRKLGYAMAVGSTLVAVGPIASSPPPLVFNLRECGLNATDIVVTDRDGVVLETWRGELRPGDTVRLGMPRLAPVNALPWDWLRMRPDRTLSGIYNPPPDETIARYRPTDFEDKISLGVVMWPTVLDVADTELRLVLFLRNVGTTGAGAIWMPTADARSRISSFCTSGPLTSDWRSIDDMVYNCGFMTSVVIVEAGRVLLLQVPASGSGCSHHGDAPYGPPLLVPIARDLNHFKKEVKALPTSPWDSTDDPKCREVAPSSLTTPAGLSSRLWAAPKK